MRIAQGTSCYCASPVLALLLLPGSQLGTWSRFPWNLGRSASAEDPHPDSVFQSLTSGGSVGTFPSLLYPQISDSLIIILVGQTPLPQGFSGLYLFLLLTSDCLHRPWGWAMTPNGQPALSRSPSTLQTCCAKHVPLQNTRT